MALDSELAKLTTEAETMSIRVRECVEENARTAQDQAAFQRKYGELLAQYEQNNARVAEAQEQKVMRSAKRKKIAEFLKLLERRDGLVQEFDEELWNATVQQVMVGVEGKVCVTFKNGEAVEVRI